MLCETEIERVAVWVNMEAGEQFGKKARSGGKGNEART